jgi:hypothetical protein
MKKLGMFTLAFALVLGLTQCKKENTTASNGDGAKVPITLNVSSGNRVAVETETGVVTFENDDVIYVASNGVCVGTLSYDGTQFAGEVTEPTEGQKLQFYFLGNKTPEFNADNTGCSVVISDQTEYLPVISYAPSRENYQVGLTAYNATLLNKCALVKFDVTTASEAATCIKGMNNKVTVSFADNSFEYSQDGEGMIIMPAGNGEKWAILLPQEEVTDAEAVSNDGGYTGTCGSIPAIADNDYLTEGIAVSIETPNGPQGIINGAFTINANGDQVYFSQGNLQYIGSAAAPYWKFADHQWDYLGTTTGQNSSDENVDRDLFGYGTSGYNHGANCYQPWSTSTNWIDYLPYGDWFYDLYDQTGQADWGYNAIANGGNTENNGWRTLTDDEFGYIISGRNTTSGIRWAKGIVNGVNGFILLPDNWTASIYALNNTNGGNYGSNTITAEDWANTLEANGAVFLPAAGHRNGTNVSYYSSNGYYWCARQTVAYSFIQGGDFFHASNPLHYGYSVRLVRNIQ